ncbi:MAG: hypothetical protein RI549_07660 [Wenzhouxiangella sp.]|nr:hypothetical protein [Wenzhouxiangella sp.]
MPDPSQMVQGGVQAPLLGRLFGGIDEDQRLSVVHCGLGEPSVFKAFAPYRVRLDTVDVFSQLEHWALAETGAERAVLIGAYMDEFKLEPVDWVCCWSLLNYIDPPTVTLILNALRPYLKPDAVVHALIEYSSPTMPASPPTWALEPVDQQLYLHADATQATADSPRHTPKRLEGMLGGMKAESTVLLSNGLQEYIFRPVDEPVADD